MTPQIFGNCFKLSLSCIYTIFPGVTQRWGLVRPCTSRLPGRSSPHPRTDLFTHANILQHFCTLNSFTLCNQLRTIRAAKITKISNLKIYHSNVPIKNDFYRYICNVFLITLLLLKCNRDLNIKLSILILTTVLIVLMSVQ